MAPKIGPLYVVTENIHAVILLTPVLQRSCTYGILERRLSLNDFAVP